MLLGVTPTCVYRWLGDNRLPVVRFSKRCVRFRESDILELVENLKCSKSIRHLLFYRTPVRLVQDLLDEPITLTIVGKYVRRRHGHKVRRREKHLCESNCLLPEIRIESWRVHATNNICREF